MIFRPNLEKPSGKLLLFLSTLILLGGLFALFGPKPPSREELSIVKVVVSKAIEPSNLSQKRDEKQIIAEGKGFLFSEDGLVFTVAHLVEDTQARYYADIFGREWEMKPVKIDEEKDIALMRIEGLERKMPSLDIRSGKTPDLNQKIFFYNNANKLSGSIRDTESAIQASSTYIKKDLNGLIQLEANISQGDSGMPIFAENDDVLGMVVAIDSQNQNMAFAIPAKALQEFLKEYLKENFGL